MGRSPRSPSCALAREPLSCPLVSTRPLGVLPPLPAGRPVFRNPYRKEVTSVPAKTAKPAAKPAAKTAKPAAKTAKLVPLGDRILVKQVRQEEVRASGLVIPDTAREKP